MMVVLVVASSSHISSKYVNKKLPNTMCFFKKDHSDKGVVLKNKKILFCINKHRYGKDEASISVLSSIDLQAITCRTLSKVLRTSHRIYQI